MMYFLSFFATDLLPAPFFWFCSRIRVYYSHALCASLRVGVFAHVFVAVVALVFVAFLYYVIHILVSFILQLLKLQKDNI